MVTCILLKLVEEQSRTKKIGVNSIVLCQISRNNQCLVLYLCQMGYTVSVYLYALKECLGTSI